MATPAQILATRQNALKSTGPRTEEGKAVSRFNALKTGIEAKSMVIPGEDAAELEKLAADYHTQFQPADPVERFLVDSMVNAEWQLRRFRKVEAGLWEFTLSGQESGLGEAYGENLKVFTRLHRRIEAIERSYHRSLRELQRLQATRVLEESTAFDDSDFGARAEKLASLCEPAAEMATAAASGPATRAQKPLDNPALRLSTPG